MSPTDGGPPLLGMLIDRTSFDETDSYGLDEQILEPWAKIKQTSKTSPQQAVVMRDGKVRRRLRWRPKNTTPNGAARRLRAGLQYRSKMMSSNGSVISSFSQISKQSKKSLHSFASTETAPLSNTKKAKKHRFPLPRPNYPTHLDHNNSNNNDGGNNSNNNENGGHHPPQQNTIVTEGASVHAKMAAGQTVFTAADNDQDEIRSGGGGGGDANTVSTLDTASLSSQQSNSPKKNNTGLPPLFRRKDNSSYNRSNTSSSFSATAQTLPPSDGSVVSGLSLESSMLTIREELDSDATASTTSLVATLSPVPVLSGDEVEADRRVDLRIVRHERRQSMGSQRSSGGRIDGGTEELADEIRSQSGRIRDDGGPIITTPTLREVFSENIFVGRKEDNQKNNRKVLNKSLSYSAGGSGSSSSSSDYYNTKKSNNTSDDNNRGCSSVPLPEIDANETRSDSPAPVSPQPPQYYDQKDERDTSSPYELRFSMSNNLAIGGVKPSGWVSPRSVSSPNDNFNREKGAATTTKNGKAHTGPVDIDDGTFLEAEKNLQAIHEMAVEHLQQGEYSEALEVFEEILRGQLARYGEDHFRVGTALHNIGVVHMRRGDYQKALAVYKEAVRVRKKALEPNHPDVAVSLAQLGVAYLETSKHQRAIGAFREALKIRRKTLGNQHPKVAKILNNIGCALYELDELDVARVAFEEALDIQRHLLRNSPNQNPNVSSQCKKNRSDHGLLSIASTQCNIASIKLYCGEFDDASIDLEEALLIQQCVLGDDHPLAKRTQESLKWVEESREKAEGRNRSPQESSALDLFNQLSLSKSEDHRQELQDLTTRTRTVFHTLERGLRKLHDELDFSCGGSAWEGEQNQASSS